MRAVWTCLDDDQDIVGPQRFKRNSAYGPLTIPRTSSPVSHVQQEERQSREWAQGLLPLDSAAARPVLGQRLGIVAGADEGPSAAGCGSACATAAATLEVCIIMYSG